ncbi:unnamed protein product, partial [Prorocentrum cordatum]
MMSPCAHAGTLASRPRTFSGWHQPPHPPLPSGRCSRIESATAHHSHGVDAPVSSPDLPWRKLFASPAACPQRCTGRRRVRGSCNPHADMWPQLFWSRWRSSRPEPSLCEGSLVAPAGLAGGSPVGPANGQRSAEVEKPRLPIVGAVPALPGDPTERRRWRCFFALFGFRLLGPTAVVLAVSGREGPRPGARGPRGSKRGSAPRGAPSRWGVGACRPPQGARRSVRRGAGRARACREGGRASTGGWPPGVYGGLRALCTSASQDFEHLTW